MILDKSAKILNEGKRNVSTNGAKAIKKTTDERKKKKGRKEEWEERKGKTKSTEQNSEHRKRSAKCGQLIFNKGGKGAKLVFSTNDAATAGHPLVKKEKESAHPSKKFNSK